MTNHIKGNLLLAPDQVIAHCCNCFCVMGAGVAKAIKTKYPIAWAVDQSTKKGDRAKLGSFSKACDMTATKTVYIYNLYGQYSWGFSADGKPPIDYLALESALHKMAEDLRLSKYTESIGLPRLGAGLAGGDWEIIEKLIAKELAEWEVNIYSL